MIRDGALAPGARIADLQVERCVGASPLAFEYLARAGGQGPACRLVEYMPAGLAERRGLQVGMRAGAAMPFDIGRRAFQLEADRFSLPRDEAITVVQRLLVEHGTAYLQLPWLGGTPLAESLGDAADPEELRAWLLTLGRALGRLHRGGVVHGAVSPQRVRRLDDGRVHLELPQSAAWALAASWPGVIDRSDAALAPEHLQPPGRTRALGPWTDVYGLAALAHLAIAGRMPPPASDAQAMHARPSLARHAGERWSAAMLMAIDRALSPDPASRPRSMDDFVAAMGLLERRSRPRPPRAEAPAAAMPPAAPGPMPTEPAALAESRPDGQDPSPRPTRPVWRWAVALLFALLAALAIWTALHPGWPGAKPRPAAQAPNEMPMSSAVRSSG